MRQLFYTLCLLTIVVTGYSQPANVQVWIDPTLHYNLSAKTRLSCDVYYRTRLNDLSWGQTIIRPGLFYSFNSHLTGMGGVGLFSTHQEGRSTRNEIRYWGGVQYNHSIAGKWSGQHYFRAEERTFYEKGAEGSSNLRLRYRISLLYLIAEKPKRNSSSQLALQYEPFFTVTQHSPAPSFFSTERVYFGVSNKLGRRVRIDAVYILQWGKQAKHDDLEFTDHILQCKLQYTLNPG